MQSDRATDRPNEPNERQTKRARFQSEVIIKIHLPFAVTVDVSLICMCVHIPYTVFEAIRLDVGQRTSQQRHNINRNYRYRQRSGDGTEEKKNTHAYASVFSVRVNDCGEKRTHTHMHTILLEHRATYRSRWLRSHNVKVLPQIARGIVFVSVLAFTINYIMLWAHCGLAAPLITSVDDRMCAVGQMSRRSIGTGKYAMCSVVRIAKTCVRPQRNCNNIFDGHKRSRH